MNEITLTENLGWRLIASRLAGKQRPAAISQERWTALLCGSPDNVRWLDLVVGLDQADLDVLRKMAVGRNRRQHENSRGISETQAA